MHGADRSPARLSQAHAHALSCAAQAATCLLTASMHAVMHARTTLQWNHVCHTLMALAPIFTRLSCGPSFRSAAFTSLPPT